MHYLIRASLQQPCVLGFGAASLLIRERPGGWEFTGPGSETETQAWGTLRRNSSWWRNQGDELGDVVLSRCLKAVPHPEAFRGSTGGWVGERESSTFQPELMEVHS